MELFWKAAAAVMICVVLLPVLQKQEGDIAAGLTVAVCCMIGTGLIQLLIPVVDFLSELQALAHTDENTLKILFKIIGISLVCEISAAVCSDSGCSALGKSLQTLGASVILYLSIPVLQMFLSLVQEILNGL